MPEKISCEKCFFFDLMDRGCAANIRHLLKEKIAFFAPPDFDYTLL